MLYSQAWGVEEAEDLLASGLDVAMVTAEYEFFR
jgi:hypothetical protein